MKRPNSQEAELFIWTDIDPVHEEDFNLWYDREHMEERVAIDGFKWARRYKAASKKARRYLALYRTENIDVFTSASYKKAFQHQTHWSNSNFERMSNTKRRVMHVTQEAGTGTGSSIGLIRLKNEKADSSFIEGAIKLASKINGVLRVRVLEPNIELSTPLPSENKIEDKLEAAIIIDTTAEPTAAAAVRVVLDQLNLSAERGLTFNFMWELHSADL